MKSRYTFLIFLLMMMAAGCNKFLDTDNLTAKTTANFPLTEKDAGEMITAIYANLLYESPETSSEMYVAQLAGDDCLGGNLSFSGNCAVNFLLYKDNLNGLLGLWSRCYRMINRANNAVATLDNVKKWSDESERLRHFGEAYFLRAMAYYELVRIFGGVPIRTTLETENLPRATVEEVYQLIAEDLKHAIEMMPKKNYPSGSELAGHATKYAAEALMARVFLFYTGRYAKQELPGGITKAQIIAWIDDCVNNSGHNLVDDQRNIWSYTNEATENNAAGHRYNYVVNNHLKWAGNSAIESVFATKYNMKADWTYTWFSNTNCLFYSPSGDNYSKAGSYPFGAGWGAGPVSPAMVNEWKAWAAAQTYTGGYTTDPRLTGSIWSYRALDPNQANTVLMDTKLDAGEPDYTVSYRYYENTGYFQKKYININSFNNNNILSFSLQMFPGISGQTSASLLQIADLIHIRFADVLLMQSELKEDATGLNRVRARSHLAPIGYSLDAVKQERRWELAFESIRYWDLLRWSGPSFEEIGNALNKQTGFNVINAAVVVPMVNYNYKQRIKVTEGYWPIPQTEIDISNGLIKQNPGWDPSAQFTDWNNY